MFTVDEHFVMFGLFCHCIMFRGRLVVLINLLKFRKNKRNLLIIVYFNFGTSLNLIGVR